jgi:hypothetical protein
MAKKTKGATGTPAGVRQPADQQQQFVVIGAVAVALIAGVWMMGSSPSSSSPIPANAAPLPAVKIVKPSKVAPSPSTTVEVDGADDAAFNEPKSNTKWTVQEDENIPDEAQLKAKAAAIPLLKKISTPTLQKAESIYAAGDVPSAMELVEREMANSLGCACYHPDSPDPDTSTLPIRFSLIDNLEA